MPVQYRSVVLCISAVDGPLCDQSSLITIALVTKPSAHHIIELENLKSIKESWGPALLTNLAALILPSGTRRTQILPFYHPIKSCAYFCFFYSKHTRPLTYIMLHFSTLLLAFSVAGSVTAAPTQLNKRIAQVISDSTAKWVAACVSFRGYSLRVPLT
jgi:hypothetical protein